MPITKWYQDKIVQAALNVQEQRMNLAVQVVVGHVKRMINRGNPTGKNPSAPGEPPKKVTARLFNSIVGIVFRERNQVIGGVGTNVIYARRLEQGFVGTDKAGRNIDQAPRPYLRPGLSQSLTRVKRLLGAR